MTVDLDGIRFVVSPGRYPPRLPFVLVQDEYHIPETRGFLQSLAPGAPFLGFVPPTARPDNLDPSATVVVSSADWLGVVTRLRRTFPPGRITVLLNPGEYPWGYLAVGRAAPDRVGELADPTVPVGLKVRWLRDYLVKHAYATFEGDHPQWYPDCYLRAYWERVRGNAAAIHDVLAGLADQDSRDAYNLVMYGSPEEMLQRFLGRVFHEQQYVEMTRLRPGDTVVNAGVADGWDIPYLLAQTGGRGRHVLVDPAESPAGTAATLRKAFGLEFIAGGLWDRAETLEFPVDKTGMVVGTRPGADVPGCSRVRVRCLALDELVEDAGLTRLDLVKMDIEGAEPRALRGMRKTLTTYRPQLAVCIYHQPEHMWTIPAQLMSWLSDYRFFVRHYSPVRFECVFYAIPAERFPAARPEDPILEAAGVDGKLLRKAWGVTGARQSFDDLVAQHAGTGADRLPVAARVVEDEVGRLLASSPPDGPPVVQIEVPLARAEVPVAGWGPAGVNRDYSWRWFPPDGAGSVFLPLDHTADYFCRLYLHHSDSQDAFDLARLEVNGRAAVDREFGMDGGAYYIQWRIPAAPDDRTRGLSRLRFQTVAGPKRVAASRVTCWRAG